jgi:hypothetical protein
MDTYIHIDTDVCTDLYTGNGTAIDTDTYVDTNPHIHSKKVAQ